jgi:hypothetical protein
MRPGKRRVARLPKHKQLWVAYPLRFSFAKGGTLFVAGRAPILKFGGTVFLGPPGGTGSSHPHGRLTAYPCYDFRNLHSKVLPFRGIN